MKRKMKIETRTDIKIGEKRLKNFQRDKETETDIKKEMLHSKSLLMDF